MIRSGCGHTLTAWAPVQSNSWEVPWRWQCVMATPVNPWFEMPACKGWRCTPASLSPGFLLLAVRLTFSLQMLLEGAAKDCVLLFPLVVFDHVILSQADHTAIINLHQSLQRAFKSASWIVNTKGGERDPEEAESIEIYESSWGRGNPSPFM